MMTIGNYFEAYLGAFYCTFTYKNLQTQVYNNSLWSASCFSLHDPLDPGWPS